MDIELLINTCLSYKNILRFAGHSGVLSCRRDSNMAIIKRDDYLKRKLVVACPNSSCASCFLFYPDDSESCAAMNRQLCLRIYFNPSTDPFFTEGLRKINNRNEGKLLTTQNGLKG